MCYNSAEGSAVAVSVNCSGHLFAHMASALGPTENWALSFIHIASGEDAAGIPCFMGKL